MVLRPAHVGPLASAGMPSRKFPVLAQKTRLPPKRRNHPDVAAQRGKLGPDGRSDLDHPGAGGACRDKGNPVSVGREGRLYVLPRGASDVYVLASVDATHGKF